MARSDEPFDRETYRTAWSALSFSERRQVLKAVNRGRPVPDRRDARFAIGAARTQQKFWRWIWLIGPGVALAQVGRGVAVFVTNLLVATIVLGGMSWWFYTRAKRAEAVNLELLQGGKAKGSAKESPGRPVATGDHLPGGGRPPPIEKHDEFRPDPNTSRKKVKRRRKRQ